MMISWDKPYKQKYLSFVYGEDWKKGEFKLFSFARVPLGWTMNIWKLSISYDNYGKIKKREVK